MYVLFDVFDQGFAECILHFNFRLVTIYFIVIEKNTYVNSYFYSNIDSDEGFY